MNKIVAGVRKIVKQPILLGIYLASKYQGFTLRDQFYIPLKLRYLTGYEEIESVRFFKKKIKKGMTVVDIGANIGYFTRLFSKLVGESGKVYAFEPDLENYPILVENTKHLTNVTVLPYAVSDEDGEATFYHVIGATGCHSLLFEPGPKKHYEERKVKVVTLDTIVPEKIDVMKIDVEGAEDKVFRGMKRHLQELPWIVFEYTQGYLDSLMEELKSSGTIYSLSSRGDLQPLSKAHYVLDGRPHKDYGRSSPLTNVAYRPGPKNS